jgi:23S rRNA (guanosine2251-2'-O)-methyltransferase
VRSLYALKNINDADDILNEAKARGIPVIYKEREELSRLVKNENNQGVAIEADDLCPIDIDQFLNKHKDKAKIAVAVLDGLEDPHNVGAIIRSCEIFGVCGIISASKRAAPINDTVFKVSAGAADYIDLVIVSNINNALLKLKDSGFWIYGFDQAADKYLDETVFDKKSALVFGNEGEGMHALVTKNCDFLVKIRQVGQIESLNVSNAAAVAFYEVMKQYNKE